MTRGILAGLLAFALVAPAAGAAPEPGRPAAQLYSYGAGGRLRPDSLRVLARLALPATRDLALGGFGGDLLLLDLDGALRIVPEGDSLPRRLLGSDLAARDWPEAVSADGPDWLLLVEGGQAVQRLGRRGEAKERWELPEAGLWRRLRADRAGRLWVSEEQSGRFLLLSRAGQRLQSWELARRLPGYQGPVQAWCPDEQGGLFIAEGWPLRLHHLNGAGNPLGSWRLALPPGELALAVDDTEQLLVAHGPEGEPLCLGLRRQPFGSLLALRDGQGIWLLARAPGGDEGP